MIINSTTKQSHMQTAVSIGLNQDLNNYEYVKSSQIDSGNDEIFPILSQSNKTSYKPFKLKLDKLLVKGTKNKKLMENKLVLDLKNKRKGQTEVDSLPKISISTPSIFLRKIPTNFSEKKLDIETDKELEVNQVPKIKTICKLKTFNMNDVNIKVSNDKQKEELILDDANKLHVSNINLPFYNYPKAIKSSISTNNIKVYGVNSYQGLIRSYNEDRVAIILSISKPSNYEGQWPNCSFFAIYDGHGGNKCCDFLRDKLHDYIIKNKYFPSNPKAALISGIDKAEYDFIEEHALDSSGELVDKSGSCACIALIIDDMCYVANIGDSRMVLSKNKGKDILVMTTDHKPNNEKERKRIIKHGGRVYQTNPYAKMNACSSKAKNPPHRIYPGGLSVSRAIGDVEAKISYLGGMKNVLIATPDITQFQINKETDFFIMGCDGIFDCLSNEECVECAWMTIKSKKYSHSIHSKSAAVVDMIIKSSLKRKTFDNVTAIFVAFESFEQSFSKCFSDLVKKTERNKEFIKQIEFYNTESSESNLFLRSPQFPKYKSKIKKSITVHS